MKEGIKAIIFDIGGVLAIGGNSINVNGNSHTISLHSFVAKKLKISLDQYFDAIDLFYVKATTGEITRSKTMKYLSKNLGATEKQLEKIYHKGYKKVFKKNKALHKKAKELKKKGYKIAILSDQWYLSSEAIVTKKLYKKFDKIVISCYDKIRKPNLGSYKLILKKLNLKPNETIFIDNQEWNIAPAKKLGMKTILFKNNKQTFEELNQLGI